MGPAPVLFLDSQPLAMLLLVSVYIIVFKENLNASKPSN